jgi:hypothetical protein
MFCESQLTLAAKIMSQVACNTFHIDATGSVVQKCSVSPTYLYAIVLPVSIIGEPALPLVEWLSDSHDTCTIASVMFFWWTKVQSLLSTPAVIVIDSSWALMHAVSKVFNCLSLKDQLFKQWLICCGAKPEKDFVCLRLCGSHYIKAISRRLGKKNICKQV